MSDTFNVYKRSYTDRMRCADRVCGFDGPGTDDEDTGPDFEIVNMAFQNMTVPAGPHQLAGVRLFDDLLSRYSSVIMSSEVGKEAFFHFMHLAQNGPSDEVRAVALSCLARGIEAPGCELEPLSRPDFVSFIFHVIAHPSPATVNSALRISAVLYSEFESAREIFRARDIVACLMAHEEFMSCAVGGIVTAVLNSCEEPSPMVVALVGMLGQLLASPLMENICYGLAGMTVIANHGWFDCCDFAALHARLPEFVVHRDVEVVSSAFRLLEALPAPCGRDFQAVAHNLSRDDGAENMSVTFLRKCVGAWSSAPPVELLPALLDLIGRQPFSRAGATVALVGYAISSPSVENMCLVMDTIGPFLDDQTVAKEVLRVFVIIAETASRDKDRSWFTKAVAGHLSSIESIAETGISDVAGIAARFLESCS